MPLETEELYHNLFETSLEIIFIVDKVTGQIIDANPSACKLYGYSKEEFQGLKNTDISAEPEETKLAMQSDAIDVPLRYHYKKDGTKFPVEITVSYFKLGERSLLTTFIKDLTQRKKAEQTLIDANVLFNTIFDTSPLAMIFLDIHGNVRMWNHSAERLFGWAVEEVLGKPNPIVPKEKEDEYNDFKKETFSKLAIAGREVVRKRKDGSLVHVSVSSSVINDSNNQALGFMAIIEDITWRKRNEELLNENEAIFSSFLEHSPIYVFFKDIEIRALRLSKNYEQMLGMPVEKALGKTMDDLFPSEFAKSMIADDLKIMNEGKRVDVVEELNGKIFKTIKFPILKDGKPFMLAGFTQDITEQEKMTQQLEMLKHSIDKHFDGAYWMDTENRFVYVNDAGCNVLRYSREELLTMRVSDVNPFAFPDKLEFVWNKLRNEGSYVSETIHRRKDGTEFPVEISSTYVKFGDKEYNCGFARDITERKKLMQTLSASEEKFAKAFMASPEAMSIASMESGIYIDVNDNFLKKTGFTREEVIGHTSTELNFWVDPNDRLFYKNQLKQEGQLKNFEVRYRLRSGEIRYFIVSSQIVEIDKKQCSLNYIDDITERRKAEKGLKESEASLSSLIQYRQESIWSIDKEFRYVIINEMFKKAYHDAYHVDIEPGMSVLEALSPELLAFWKPRYEAALSGEMVQFEFSAYVFNETRYFSVSITPVVVNNNVIGASVISIDITSRKKEEEALQQSEEKFRTMAEQMIDILFTLDIDGVITYLSPSVKSVFGMEPSEMMGCHFTDFMDDNEKAQAPLAFENSIKNDIPTKNLILTLKRNDGSSFSGEINSTAVKNSQGTVTGIIGLIRDITEKNAFEEAMKNERNLLRTLIDNLPDFIFFKDAEGRYLLNNQAHLHSIGYERQEDVLGKIAFNLHPKEFAEQYTSDEFEIIRSGQAMINKEETVFRKDINELRWHLTSKIPIKDSKGKVISIVGISRDITERKQMEEALKLSEERLRLALEGANDGIWDVNMETGAVYMSPRGCEILGYRPDEMHEIVCVWSDLVYSDDLPLTEERLTSYLQGQTSFFEVEQRLKMKSGKLKWVLTRGMATERRTDGSPVRMIGTHTDITNRKQIEDALKTSEEKYRTLFENMTVGFALHEMIFDKDGNPLDYKFLEINPVFEKLTGLKASEIVGKRVKEVIPNIEQYWINFYGEVVKTGIPASYQNFVLEFGKYYDVWVFSPKDNHFATIFNDITQQKHVQEELKLQNAEYQSLNEEYIALNEELLERNERLGKFNQELGKAKEKAEESDRLKTAFLCNMSHEIRTPMNAILGFSEFIVRPELSEEKKAHFSKLIKDRTYDLLRIIEDILDISKIEIGQMNLVESEIHITSLLKDLLEYYIERKESQKPTADIEISLNVSRSLVQPIILADGQRLKQVLMNFLDNSLKFTMKGSIELACEVIGTDKLLFIVSDTGIGIPAEKQDIVFDRFRQAEDLYSTRHYGGTGLGLSIAKGLVHLMGGDIWLESEVNVGTKFFVTIPYKKVNRVHQEKEKLKIQEEFQWKGKTILVVEDDETSAELLNEFIETTQAKVINALTGQDALDSFRETKNLDLVLLDIRLPDANGLDIARKMKAIHPNIPIIAQTAYATESDYKDSIDAGCDSYIAKPIQKDKLLELISKFV